MVLPVLFMNETECIRFPGYESQFIRLTKGQES